MAILEEHFYHGTIKLYTAMFGTLFNDIKIKRENNKLIKVPLSYAGQQKQNTRLDENPDPNAVRYKNRLPMIVYMLTGFEKDDSRVTNKMHTLYENVDRNSVDSLGSQLNRVPYTFSYDVIIRTKHIDDMLQIIEQIVPYFNPSIQVVLDDNKDLDSQTTISVSLNATNFQDQFEGSYEENRIIETTLSFTLDGYLYAATDNAGIIKKVTVNYINLLNPDDILETFIFDENDL